jgi:light-regulated signal transduction histidine kinase (bacteriophytochrome)
MMEYELVPTDIPTVLAPIVDDAMVNAARKEIKVSLDMRPVPRVLNPERCAQIFTNLLSNAVKYTRRSTVCIEVRPSATGVCVSVKDSGVGIAPGNSQVFKSSTARKCSARQRRRDWHRACPCQGARRSHGGCITASSTVERDRNFQEFRARLLLKEVYHETVFFSSASLPFFLSAAPPQGDADRKRAPLSHVVG